MTAEATAASTPAALASAPPVTRLDPRTVLLALLVINALVLGGSSVTVLLVAALLVGTLLATTRRPRLLVPYLLAVAVSLLVCLELPQLTQGLAAGTLAAIAYWTARFSVTLGLFGYLFASTGVGELVAALAALRVPRLVLIPFAVMLRFIPTVLEELRAILDAMRLRGVLAGGIVHPYRMAVHVLVPLLASTSRIVDELSASALLRGLGTSTRPTTIVRLRLGVADGIVLCVIAVLLALQLTGTEVIAWMPRRP